MIHAFISCKANETFFEYLKDLVLRAFNLKIEIDIVLLLKMNSQTEIDLIMTIAFSFIYKMIIFRNKYGYDNRDLNLIYLFKRGMTNRIQNKGTFESTKYEISCEFA